MGIFAKQGPYQEFKDLFVKEFDADKTITRLNKAEEDLNTSLSSIKRSDALDREAGQTNSLLTEYQQKFNQVAEQPSSSLWAQKNAAQQLAVDYANDPRRVALGKSKQALAESVEANKGKADTAKAAKMAQLVHDAQGGTSIDESTGNINTLQHFSVPKDFDANTLVNQVGAGFETNGISWEADPKSGVEGYWQTTTTGEKIRLASDIRSVAKSNIYQDADTIKHLELDNFDKLHDDYTALYEAKGMSKQEAERNATVTLLNKPKVKNDKGELVEQPSILDKAVDKNVSALADAAATKFKTKYTDRKLNQFQEVKGEGTTTEPSFPLDTHSRNIKETETEGVPVLDPENAINEDNYKNYNKNILKLNKMKTELSKNVHVKSLIPIVEKIHSLPENQQSMAYTKATQGLFSKIVGNVPTDMSKLTAAQKKIYDGKIKTYTKALSDLYNYYNSSEESSSYIKAVNETKHVLSTNYGVSKENMPKTLEGLQKMITAINDNKKKVIQTQEIPSAEAIDNLTKHTNQVLSEADTGSSVIGGTDKSLDEALSEGSYENASGANITSVQDLKIEMAKPNSNVYASGISFVKDKSLTTSTPKVVLNVYGKHLYLNPSNDLRTALEPYGSLDLQQHRADIAAKSKPVTIKTASGKDLKVKIKYDNLIPRLYDVEAKKYVPNGDVVLKEARDAAIKANSTFTTESVVDPLKIKVGTTISNTPYQ